MEEKLLRRAACQYRQWMLSQKFKQTTEGKVSVIDSLAKTRDKADQMLKWTERFFIGSEQRFQPSPCGCLKWKQENYPTVFLPKSECKECDGTGIKIHHGIVAPEVYENLATTMVPELGSDVFDNVKYALSMLEKMVDQKTVTVISIKEALDEMKAIVSEWPEVRFKGGTLSVKTKNITLEDENEKVFFGSFWMKVNLLQPFYSPKIETIDCVISEEGFFHPHVSVRGDLCIGDGGLPAKDALCQGRLEDYFRVVEAVLQTYNPVSPYAELRQWYDPDREGQFYCYRCEEWRSDESSCYCEGCDSIYCDRCNENGGYCTDCGDYRCEVCIDTCRSCDSSVCNNCKNECEGCREVACENCFSSCTVCENCLCSSCCSECCAYCGDQMCENCTATCGCCENNNCDACINEVCSECKKDICKGCQTTCNECNKVICQTCEDNKCVDCGVAMCQTCVEEHTCLLSEVKNAK